jgi:protocatechuate 3,4-dioxygenase beta subunit
VFEPDGKTPAAKVLIHTYHRDHDGFEFGVDEKQYPAWQLHGWVKTDKNGKFEVQTIKPASDHMGREGAHIHFTVISKDYGKQWAPKVFLADDPITQKQRKSISSRNNIIAEIKNNSDVQSIEIEFSLKKVADF